VYMNKKRLNSCLFKARRYTLQLQLVTPVKKMYAYEKSTLSVLRVQLMCSIHHIANSSSDEKSRKTAKHKSN
jgi:hypothetical protein